MKCIPLNYDTPCSADYCDKCIYENSDLCAICKSNYTLNEYGSCTKIITELPREEKIPVIDTIKNEDIYENGTCRLNISDYKETNDNEVLTIP